MAAPIQTISAAQRKSVQVEVYGPNPAGGAPMLRQRFTVVAYTAQEARDQAFTRVQDPIATGVIAQGPGGANKVVIHLAGTGRAAAPAQPRAVQR